MSDRTVTFMWIMVCYNVVIPKKIPVGGFDEMRGVRVRRDPWISIFRKYACGMGYGLRGASVGHLGLKIGPRN